MLQVLRETHPVVWIPESPPLVTVRIATFNRGELVRDRAIASALGQTYANLEVVVVGDGCDAATERAVRSVKDPRVRFENLRERGRYPDDPRLRWMVAGSAPMNRALDLARGDWIAPLDDDDEFTSDHIEALLDACRSRDLELAFGVAEVETEPGQWEHVGGPTLQLGTVVHAAVLFWRHLGIIRHDLDAWRLDEPGDWNVWRRMVAAGARVGFVDHVVARHYLERRELR
jgi:glycosyltransferase involved in cell wall biosynthesis